MIFAANTAANTAAKIIKQTFIFLPIAVTVPVCAVTYSFPIRSNKRCPISKKDSVFPLLYSINYFCSFFKPFRCDFSEISV